MKGDQSVSIGALGPKGAGKTSLLRSYCFGRASTAEQELWLTSVELEGKEVELALYDSDDLRAPLNVFLVCFAIDDQEGLSDAENVVRELRSEQPRSCVLLVGCKADLRDSAPDDGDARYGEEDMPPLPLPPSLASQWEAEELAHTLSCAGYVECSIFRELSVREVLRAAVRASIAHGRVRVLSRGADCCVLL
eukprot:PLAT13251.1.p1 GENE.PLAT13251.1~~PLAT13251.1.p1  ORF type:complete len:212 (+),score=52.46 PLAT13251.1:60-638(+)